MAADPAAVPELDPDQLAVVGHGRRRVRVLAGPGTGKTTTLVETVVERITSGAAAVDDVLVLTFSRRAAGELTRRLADRLGVVVREPLVRTLHSYAFSLVRREAIRRGDPVPRMLGAAESDQVIRELLAGHAEDGTGGWPSSAREALRTGSFASEVRDILSRSAERGIEPRRLAAVGEKADRPDWVAVGRLAQEYREVTDLRQGSSGLGSALDQAELTAAAVAALRRDTVLADEQRRYRRIFVDEYQDVDPAQAALIELLASGADELMVLGDPDQAIYGFRGSEAAALRDIEVDGTLTLTASRRLPTALVSASRRIAAALPGDLGHRELTGTADPAAELSVTVLPTPAQEAAAVADRLRRAHLLDGVPWRRMAVLLRSPAATLPMVTRACAAAGVPLLVAGSDQPVAADPVVDGLLGLLRHAVDPALTAEAAQHLLLSPVGGLDPMSLRRLRRALRRADPTGGASAELVAGALVGPDPADLLPDDLLPPVEQLRALLALARSGAEVADGRELLHQLWTAGGWENVLVERSDRGGRSGERADRSLDATIGLFRLADDLADRLPGAGVRALLELVLDQRIPGDDPARADRGTEAVAVMSAHSAKGLEWDVVAVLGVQDDTWPDLRHRASLLHGDDLVAEAARSRRRVSDDRQLIEERRLFYVAVTRARRTLICTAVDDEDHTPSRFLHELTGLPELPAATGPGIRAGRRRLHLVDLVADLRRNATDPTDPDRAAAAAHHLARLAAAGVRGAHPRDWYGLADLSTDDPVIPDGVPVRISPSTVERLAKCPLQVVLERRGARSTPGAPQIEGIAVHALTHGLGLGLSDTALAGEIDRYLGEQDQLPPWQRARVQRVLTAMLSAARTWATEAAVDRDPVGTEVPIDVLLPAEHPGDRPVRVVGRMDWLSRTRADGRLVITDFKTAATKSTKAEAAANPQLGTYQVAVELSGLGTAGGGELVHLRGGKPSTLSQPALTDQDRAVFLGSIRAGAEQLATAEPLARVTSRCDNCPVRSSCPAHAAGRQVTS